MAKAVTLKNADGEEVYPVTSLDLVVGSNEWVYLGGAKTTNATTATIDFNFPQQYDCYHIIASATYPSSSSSGTIYLRWLNNGTVISPIDVQVLDWTNATPYPATYYDQDFFAHTNMTAYGRLNTETESYLSASGDWRMTYTRMNLINDNLHIRLYNTTNKTATQPNGVRLTSTANMGNGTFLKVWGCNKP